MALGDKHAKLSFSRWPWAPDARKRENLEARVALRHGGIALFASPALLIRESLDLLITVTFQSHKEVADNTSKKLRTKNGTGTETTQTFPDVAFKLDFDCLFDAKGARNVHKMVRKTSPFRRAGRKRKVGFRLRWRERIIEQGV